MEVEKGLPRQGSPKLNNFQLTQVLLFEIVEAIKLIKSTHLPNSGNNEATRNNKRNWDSDSEFVARNRESPPSNSKWALMNK